VHVILAVCLVSGSALCPTGHVCRHIDGFHFVTILTRGWICCSGTTFIFEVLHKHGHDAVAVDVLTETSYPSFGHMVTNTATTLWESWEGSAHKIEGGGTSRNHIMCVVAIALLCLWRHSRSAFCRPG
jgi:hypothetical protein